MLVDLEKSENIGILRLRRPERANALNRALLQSLENLQESVRSDSSIRVLITTGEGKGFSSGSDLEELAELAPEDLLAGELLESRVGRNFLSLPQPTIAAVHGYALGGGLFLAAYHDFRIVASNVRLALPEVKLGWNPTFGMQRLIQLVGMSAAAQWLMYGDEFSAAEAKRRGFSTTLVPRACDVLPAAMKWAKGLAAVPPSGLAMIKSALWQESMSRLEMADKLEAQLFQRCVVTPEAQTSLRRYAKDRSGGIKKP